MKGVGIKVSPAAVELRDVEPGVPQHGAVVSVKVCVLGAMLASTGVGGCVYGLYPSICLRAPAVVKPGPRLNHFLARHPGHPPAGAEPRRQALAQRARPTTCGQALCRARPTADGAPGPGHGGDFRGVVP
jgi:hypothetical protein